MQLACLDLEGVLVPEVWIAVAEATGIAELRLTTRDISDYDELMHHRLAVLDAHNLKLPDIQAVIATLEPLPGAPEFLDWLRERYQVIILSDTFYQFADPLMAQLGRPTLFCHQLEVADDGTVLYDAASGAGSGTFSYPPATSGDTAKTGTITKALHGCRIRCSRSLAGTAARAANSVRCSRSAVVSATSPSASATPRDSQPAT